MFNASNYCSATYYVQSRGLSSRLNFWQWGSERGFMLVDGSDWIRTGDYLVACDSIISKSGVNCQGKVVKRWSMTRTRKTG